MANILWVLLSVLIIPIPLALVGLIGVIYRWNDSTVMRVGYGITYNAALEAGGVLIGEKLKIEIEVEAVKS